MSSKKFANVFFSPNKVSYFLKLYKKHNYLLKKIRIIIIIILVQLINIKLNKNMSYFNYSIKINLNEILIIFRVLLRSVPTTLLRF